MQRLTVAGIVLTLGAQVALAQNLPGKTHDAVVSGPNDASILTFSPASAPPVATQAPVRKQEPHGVDVSGKSGGKGDAANGSPNRGASDGAGTSHDKDMIDMDGADTVNTRDRANSAFRSQLDEPK